VGSIAILQSAASGVRMPGTRRGIVMRLAKIAALALLLSGCAPDQELFTKPAGTDQAQLDQAYAAYRMTWNPPKSHAGRTMPLCRQPPIFSRVRRSARRMTHI
jgi:hypothetical protein